MTETFNSLSFLANAFQTSPARVKRAIDHLGILPAILFDGRPMYSAEDTARLQRYFLREVTR